MCVEVAEERNRMEGKIRLLMFVWLQIEITIRTLWIQF